MRRATYTIAGPNRRGSGPVVAEILAPDPLAALAEETAPPADRQHEGTEPVRHAHDAGQRTTSDPEQRPSTAPAPRRMPKG